MVEPGWIAEASDKELIEALLDVEDGLSQWEMNFADSLARWSGLLTLKQRNTAEKILRKMKGLPSQPAKTEEQIKAMGEAEQWRNARLRASRRRLR